jgi:hypothetical protein
MSHCFQRQQFRALGGLKQPLREVFSSCTPHHPLTYFHAAVAECSGVQHINSPPANHTDRHVSSERCCQVGSIGMQMRAIESRCSVLLARPHTPACSSMVHSPAESPDTATRRLIAPPIRSAKRPTSSFLPSFLLLPSSFLPSQFTIRARYTPPTPICPESKDPAADGNSLQLLWLFSVYGYGSLELPVWPRLAGVFPWLATVALKRTQGNNPSFIAGAALPVPRE